MHGTGLPLATPFTADGDVDHDALAALVEWVEARGVDFIVPCGSNSEAPLLTRSERAEVVDTVATAADRPVLAGTGAEGFEKTLSLTRDAAEVGADAALVVTPYYFDHDQATLAGYYRELADTSPLPVYCYSVPAYTGTRLAPETVGELAEHPNVAGMKDSSGDLAAFKRVGGTGGVLAVANVLPELAATVFEADSSVAAAAANDALLEVNELVTGSHGIPGLKAAMRARDAPAGVVRRPHRPVDDGVADRLASAVEDALAAL